MVVMKSSPHPVPTQPSPQGGGPAFLPPSLRGRAGVGGRGMARRIVSTSEPP